MAKQSKHLYEFDPLPLDPEERLLFRGKETIPLPPKAFKTWLIRVDRSEEANLSQNIFLLRKALGDSAQNAPSIATVPGRGYRLAEKVRQVVEEEGDPVVQSDFFGNGHYRNERPWTSRRLFGLALVVLWVGGLNIVATDRESVRRRAPRNRTANPTFDSGSGFSRSI
jgi:DNA-binding winged helix-turn-helix (wHTH) protein